MKLTLWRIVLVLGAVMVVLFAAWEMAESVLLAGSGPEVFARFYVVRLVVTAVLMSLLTAWLLVRYRRGYERRLRECWEESERIRLFFENIVKDAGEAIVSLDPDGVIRTWNRAAERIYGHAAGEIVGRSFHLLVPPDLLAAGEPQRFAEMMQQEGVVRDVETRRLRKDGSEITVRITRSLLRDAEGRIAGYSAIVRDITAERSLEARLLQAEKMAAVGQAAASMAHEVRNALAGISGTVEVLERSPLWKQLPREVSLEVKLQIGRIAQSVDDLLNYARPGRLHLKRTDVHKVLERALASSSRGAQPGAARVARALAEGALTADIDSVRIEQAFQNVVANALQAMPGGGTLTVATRPVGDAVEVSFRDTGAGMAPEILARAFDPFFTTKARGTGLGLPIVRSIIEAHGGRVDLASAAGAGTTLIITLPGSSGVARPEAGPEAPPLDGAPVATVAAAARTERASVPVSSGAPDRLSSGGNPRGPSGAP